ncbi:MAG: Gfo/Idh/MocA family oxidoreductase [Clostridia bacterium]|nr:Gfo/Idh/MocA family oxidoreductase [Clostridia bacterium]
MNCVKVVLVGAGDRARTYAQYALEYPDKMKVVGLVDPRPEAIDIGKKLYGVPDEHCFSSVEDFVKYPRFADAVINGTMDNLHVQTTLPLLDAGYDVLLEKPFAISDEEVNALCESAKRNKRFVMICHVLRYAPFYNLIKQQIIKGKIGEIINIQMSEEVSYHHMAASYVRGKWSSEKLCFAPMLLAKCCHDVDLMIWFNSDTVADSVASFGSNFQFTPERRPAGSADRCADCKLEPDCVYSAFKHYIERGTWGQYVWTCFDGKDDPTREDKINSLKGDNQYGRCVWACKEHDIVDHQSVIVNFKNGSTGSLTMVGGASEGVRDIRIVGTKGEIIGNFKKQKFVVQTIDPDNEKMFNTEEFDANETSDIDGMTGGHGGGDLRLAADFVNHLLTGKSSIACTEVGVSAIGHKIVFAAERSRKTGKVIKI